MVDVISEMPAAIWLMKPGSNSGTSVPGIFGPPGKRPTQRSAPARIPRNQVSPSAASDTPGASVLDAAIFVWAGYYGSQRSGRLSTGIVTATVTSVIGFTTFFVYAAITRPTLLLAPFGNPFIFVIMTILLAIAVAIGIVAGMAGAVAGRWLPPNRWRARLS